MTTREDIVGCIWIDVEIFTFFSNVAVCILFMFLRALKEQEVKITLVDQRKQLPTVDTIEALNVIIQQYQTFAVPMVVQLAISGRTFVEYLSDGE